MSTFVLAFVGMPGSGKSEASAFLHKKGIPIVRLGDLTEKVVKEKNLPLTPENEEKTREALRKEFGMGVYAKRAIEKIKTNVTRGPVIIDGLYSWEEYIILKQEFRALQVVHVYAEPSIRYERLSKRKVRPFTKEEARKRDIAEIEHVAKGGPIAIADFCVMNNTNLENLYAQLGILEERITR